MCVAWSPRPWLHEQHPQDDLEILPSGELHSIRIALSTTGGAATMGSGPFEQLVVLRVGADPHPQQRVLAGFDGQGPVA